MQANVVLKTLDFASFSKIFERIEKGSYGGGGGWKDLRYLGGQGGVKSNV